MPRSHIHCHGSMEVNGTLEYLQIFEPNECDVLMLGNSPLVGEFHIFESIAIYLEWWGLLIAKLCDEMQVKYTPV